MTKNLLLALFSFLLSDKALASPMPYSGAGELFGIYVFIMVIVIPFALILFFCGVGFSILSNFSKRKTKEERADALVKVRQDKNTNKDRISQAIAVLEEKSYSVKEIPTGWEITEPLGGRPRVYSLEDLENYSSSRKAL